MITMDERIRITKSILVGKKNGVDIYYIEGCYPKDTADPVTLPTQDIATGSILEEIETGTVKQFSEKSSTWVDQFSFQS